MKREYLIAFSSFYKAIYAQEKLMDKNVKSTLRKLPPEVIKSCGYALYLRADSIQSVMEILAAMQITTKGAYLIDTSQGRTDYKRVA